MGNCVVVRHGENSFTPLALANSSFAALRGDSLGSKRTRLVTIRHSFAQVWYFPYSHDARCFLSNMGRYCLRASHMVHCSDDTVQCVDWLPVDFSLPKERNNWSGGWKQRWLCNLLFKKCSNSLDWLGVVTMSRSQRQLKEK